MTSTQVETILVVDDVPANIDILADILRADYRVIFATSGSQALEAALTSQPSLILLDVMMSGMDGYEACRYLKADPRTSAIPVIFLTAQADPGNEEFGLQIGAVDFLHKPCHPAIVRQRVRIHLDLRNQNLALERKVHQRTQALNQTRVEIIRRLGRAAEYRDNETGMHVIRMSKCCNRLALAAGIPAAQAELLELAAPMHDIGKIGIPDHILLKPGKLTDAEWVVMKTHTLIGAEIIGNHDSELLSIARMLALTHHERWDGKGYPNALAGEAIPIEGRIAAICDVYDALLSVRPYKKAWSQTDTINFMLNESGKAFDPKLLALFMTLLPEFVQIRNAYLDTPEVIYQLIYVSTATRELNDDELAVICDYSNENNAAHKVTGMLLYSQGSFMQVLEGDEAAVRNIMSQIRLDSRHHSIYQLSKEIVVTREFGNWSMGFRRFTTSDTTTWPGYAPFFKHGFTAKTIEQNKGVAMEMLKRFAAIK